MNFIIVQPIKGKIIIRLSEEVRMPLRRGYNIILLAHMLARIVLHPSILFYDSSLPWNYRMYGIIHIQLYTWIHCCFNMHASLTINYLNYLGEGH